MLNRPTDATVGEAVPALAELIGPDHASARAAPSRQTRSRRTASTPSRPKTPKLIVGGVGMVDLDAPPELSRVRVFAGYSGWGPGQLDSELAAEGWIRDDARVPDLFAEGDLWSRVLERKGGEFSLLARMPSDPSVN